MYAEPERALGCLIGLRYAMASDLVPRGLADPTSRDKGLPGLFVVASLLSHAALIATFSLVGPPRRPEPAAPAAPAVASSLPEVEVVEAEPTERAIDSETAIDEVAGRSGAARPAVPEPTIEAPPPAPTDPAPLPPPPRPSAPARPKPAASAPPAPSAAASSAPAASASAGAGGAGSGLSDQDGAGHALKAPDLAKRFTKELPAYAYAVPGWADVSDGDVGPVEITLFLNDRGKVLHDNLVIDEKPAPPPILVDSVKRAVRSLGMTLALPGHPVRAGSLKLTIRARVKHGAPRPDIQKFRIESDSTTKPSRAEFELESGLLVVFEITVGAVVADE